MAEEIIDQEVNLDEQDPGMDANDYIANINKIKNSTVSKEKYEQLKKENQTLADALLDGTDNDSQQAVPEPSTKEKVARQQELRNIIFDTNTDKTNLELAKDMLELRDLTIELDGADKDPFLPKGSRINVTQNDYIGAKKFADSLKHCIEVSDGDSEFFTNELQRITKDAMPFGRH